jgi:hypothetical protein
MRSALDDFSRCAKRLGIFGFDLSETSCKLQDHHQRVAVASEQIRNTTAKLMVDFAVLDEQTSLPFMPFSNQSSRSVSQSSNLLRIHARDR